MTKNNKRIIILSDLTVNSCLTKYSLLILEGFKSRGIDTEIICINNSIPTPNIKNADCILQFVPEDNFVYFSNIRNIGVSFNRESYYSEALVEDVIVLPKYIYNEATPTTKEKLAIPQLINDIGKYIFYTINDSFLLSNTNLLIRAFFEEFDPSEPVGLIIKTGKEIDAYVQEIKKDLNLYSNLDIYKKIFVLTGVMPYSDIELLHNTGDCFVFTDKGTSYSNDIYNHGNTCIDINTEEGILRSKMRAAYNDRNNPKKDLFTDRFNIENVLNKIERVIYES